MATPTKATVADLYALPDSVKAEFVDGEIAVTSPIGDLPGSASGIIYASLLGYARRTKSGRAYADNTGFLVDLPHRSSFSPDAAFYIGKRTGMRFLEGAPIFAVEVRSENDYGPAAERAIDEKRAVDELFE
jgi:Uma2 family endonuclease